LTEFNLPNDKTAITLKKDEIEVTSNSISLYIRGDGEVDTPFGKITDGFGVSTGDGKIEEAVAAHLNSKKELEFTVPSADVKIDHLDFHVDGALGHLADWILEQLSDNIEDSLNPQLTKSIKDATLQALAKISGDHSDTVDISDVPIEIDFYPDAEPTIETGFASIGLDGSIIPNTTKKHPPFSNTIKLPLIDNDDKNDAQIFVSQYMLDSALWALTVTDFLNYLVSNSSLPSNTPVALDTSSLFILFPNLTRQFGEGQLVELNCSVTGDDFPKANITTENLKAVANGACDMYAQNATTKEYQFVLTMLATIEWQMNATVNDAKYEIIFNLNEIFVDKMTTANSTIGTVNDLLLQDKFNAVLVVSQPFIKKKLQSHPLPLPKIENCDITNPKLYLKEGYIEVTATPKFKPFAEKFFVEKEETKLEKIVNKGKQAVEDIFGYVDRIIMWLNLYIFKFVANIT